MLKLFNIFMIYLYHLANFKKWSNTLKQFVRNLATNCLSVFDHFAGLVLKGLSYLSGFSFNWDSQITGERGKEEANSTLSQEIFAAWNFRSNFFFAEFFNNFSISRHFNFAVQPKYYYISRYCNFAVWPTY